MYLYYILIIIFILIVVITYGNRQLYSGGNDIDVLYSRYKNSNIKKYYATDPKIIKNKVDHILKVIGPYLKLIKTYLDIGCGDGLVSSYMSKGRFDVELADVVDVRTDKSKQFYLIEPNKPIPTNKKYDLVSCFHIIHHASNFFPYRINQIHDLLNEDGLFIIKEHDKTDKESYIINKHLQYEIDEIEKGLTREQFQKWVDSYPNQFYLKSQKDMINSIENAGFQLLKVQNSYKSRDGSYLAVFKKITKV